MSNLSSLVNRTLFGLAFVLAALAVLEKVANVLGYTILGEYSPSRLLELAAVALLFVIALLLREMRGEGRRAA
jgi:hypothetical protein